MSSCVLNILQYPYHFSGKLIPVSHHSQSITVFLCLDVISSISVCVLWLLSCYCTPPRRACLSHLHFFKNKYLYILIRPPLQSLFFSRQKCDRSLSPSSYDKCSNLSSSLCAFVRYPPENSYLSCVRKLGISKDNSVNGWERKLF